MDQRKPNSKRVRRRRVASLLHFEKIARLAPIVRDKLTV
jgi:hypothetical protein